MKQGPAKVQKCLVMPARLGLPKPLDINRLPGLAVIRTGCRTRHFLLSRQRLRHDPILRTLEERHAGDRPGVHQTFTELW